MNLEKYYTLDGSRLSFTRQQASDFAKSVAGDFNPIHDVDSKRFCVPGDLLFSIIVHHYGLRQIMGISFSGMVGDDITLILPEVNTREISIYDEHDKKYLGVSTNGEQSLDEGLIESLTASYVRFSGETFPHVLVPLMKENNVMINTERPLVIYDHMRISLDRLDIDSVNLSLSESIFRLYGKRGDVALNYDLSCNGEVVGKGQKKMVLSGLREYDQASIDELIATYNARKNHYTHTDQ
ncbi:MAG: DUF3581 domain-containing protein [Gammaproteobacteria bacterium]|nr:DUF3581 domain-containing protein [Gammaproteobacteria bacterium]MDH3857884.1 DUF3581 domain-containing protein [Gammaproteobacteria bacterium]